MPKELAFEQILRNGTTVDRDEGFVRGPVLPGLAPQDDVAHEDEDHHSCAADQPQVLDQAPVVTTPNWSVVRVRSYRSACVPLPAPAPLLQPPVARRSA